MSRVAPYARGAWSRGPRRAAGGSAAADPVRARRRVIWHGGGHARPPDSELVRACLSLVFSAQFSGVSSSALPLVASARRSDVVRIFTTQRLSAVDERGEKSWARLATCKTLGERRDFAPNDVITSDESTAAINVKYRQVYAMALYQDTSASREDLVEAVATLRELARYWKRVAGDVNPDTLEVLTELDRAGMTLEDVAAP